MALPLFRAISCGLLGVLCLAGCSSQTPAPTEGMSIAVSFDNVHRCSRISPEITIYNPPRGTSYYEVRLTQVGTSRYLGGGRWSYGGINEDGADVIPMGALLTSYRGPCPSAGSVDGRQFTYTVSAMASGSSQPLAVSNYTIMLEN